MTAEPIYPYIEATDWTCPDCGATCAPDEGFCMLCGGEEDDPDSRSEVDEAYRRWGLLPADTPSHVVRKPGDRRSICGMKDALPSVAAKWVDAHVKGHGMVVCPACAKGMTA